MGFTNNVIYFYNGVEFMPIIGELDENTVKYVPQSLTPAQQTQVFTNLGRGFDSVPTENSNNLITSGAVYDAIQTSVVTALNTPV